MRKSLVVGVVLAVMAVGYCGSRWLLSGAESPAALAHRALNAPTEQEQEEAAVALSYSTRAGVEEHLRTVLRESQVPAVRAACIQGVRVRQYYGSAELLFAALEDPSPLVSGRAAATLTQWLGRDHFFRPDAPREQRDRTIRAMRQSWEEIQTSPLLKEYWQRHHVLFGDGRVEARQPHAIDPTLTRIHDELWRPERDPKLGL